MTFRQATWSCNWLTFTTQLPPTSWGISETALTTDFFWHSSLSPPFFPFLTQQITQALYTSLDLTGLASCSCQCYEGASHQPVAELTLSSRAKAYAWRRPAAGSVYAELTLFQVQVCPQSTQSELDRLKGCKILDLGIRVTFAAPSDSCMPS